MYGEISVMFTFDTAHRIVGHKGKCARLHGHTYKIHVMAAGEVDPDTGFVVDFGDIKDYVNEWDHRMLLWNQDPLCVPEQREFWIDEGVIWVPFNPTAENMAQYLASGLLRQHGFTSLVVELWETPNCMARAVL